MTRRTWLGLAVLATIAVVLSIHWPRPGPISEIDGIPEAVPLPVPLLVPSRQSVTIDILPDHVVGKLFLIPGMHVDVNWAPAGEADYSVVQDVEVTDFEIWCTHLQTGVRPVPISLSVTPAQDSLIRSHMAAGSFSLVMRPEPNLDTLRRSAITIDVDNDSEEIFFFVPGSQVDVSWSPSGELGYTILENVLVLALELGCDRYHERRTREVTIYLTPDQVARLDSHRGAGMFRFRMRPIRDEAGLDTSLRVK